MRKSKRQGRDLYDTALSLTTQSKLTFKLLVASGNGVPRIWGQLAFTKFAGLPARQRRNLLTRAEKRSSPHMLPKKLL